MSLTNAGRDLIATALVGESYTAFDNTNAYIGVGNGDGAFSATQAELQGASTQRNGMESGYPDRTANAIDFRALYDTSEANFAWEEWGVFNDSTGGTMLNRVVESLGTKTSSQSWQFTVTVTVAIGS